MPKEASIEIIKRCPNRCLHCSSSSHQGSSGQMPLATICNALEDLAELGFDSVSISGGEPLIHPNLIDVIGFAHDAHLNVSLYTSGLLFAQGNSVDITSADESFYKRALHSGLDKVIFNLQSVNDKTYDASTGTHGRLPIVIEGIRHAVRAGLAVEAHFVPTKLNYKEIPDVIAFCEREGLNRASFLKLMPHGRALQNREVLELSSEENDEMKTCLAREASRSPIIRIGIPLASSQDSDMCERCHAVHEKLYIRYDGCVFGCEAFKYLRFCGADGTEIKPDNIYDKRLTEIVACSEMLKANLNLVRLHTNTTTGIPYHGENCPVQSYLKETRYVPGD